MDDADALDGNRKQRCRPVDGRTCRRLIRSSRITLSARRSFMSVNPYQVAHNYESCALQYAIKEGLIAHLGIV